VRSRPVVDREEGREPAKIACRLLGGLVTTGTFRRRPMTPAMSRTGKPSSATAWYLAPAAPFSSASLKRRAGSSRCTAGQRLSPSPANAKIPFLRARAII
jgi:hypothetical protein